MYDVTKNKNKIKSNNNNKKKKARQKKKQKREKQIDGMKGKQIRYTQISKITRKLQKR